MKTMLVYYSHDGNTEFAAKKIAELLHADLLKLEPEKAYPTGKFSKFIWGGKSVLFNEKPKLSPYTFTQGEYDTIILATPVWASSFAPPLATFLEENSFQGAKVALLACHGGGGAEKCFAKFESQLSGAQVTAKLALQDPLKNPESQSLQQDIENFCAQLTR